MDLINKFLQDTQENLWIYFGIPILVVLGLYFTIRLMGLQFTKIPLMFKLLFKKSDNTEGISSFQSFAMALAARVGVGSLAGVALAIKIGGWGSIFWMWVMALLGAASAFVESTLAQVFKERQDGLSYGGAPYYIKNGLKMKKFAIFFAVIFAFTYGLIYPMVQTNSITTSITTISGDTIHPLIPTVLVAIILSLIIFGGAKSIAKVTEKIVPIMGISFFLLGVVLIFARFNLFGDFFVTIFKGAFNLPSFATGTGVSAIIAIGVKRGIFANEAGMGTGPTAAAAAEVKYASESGLTQALSVLITTLIIGTTTAFIIFSAQLDMASAVGQTSNGIEMTIMAFYKHFGTFGEVFLATAVFLFAFSTILTACYYLESNVLFVIKNKSVLVGLKILVIILVLIGGVANADLLWSITDLFAVIMASINAIVIFFLFRYAITAWKKEKNSLE